MAHQLDLLAIGDCTQDVFIGIDDATVRCDIDKDACVLTLRYADKIPVTSVHPLTGGNASNNAIGSARLGMSAGIYTILGQDEIGNTIQAEFEQEGVDVSHIVRDTQRPSNYSAILNFQGERTILVHHEDRDYRLPDLGAPRWVYVTSMGKGSEVLFQPLLDQLAALDQVAEQSAQEAHTKLAMNPGTHQLHLGYEGLQPILQRLDLLFVNKEEARILTPRSGIEQDPPSADTTQERSQEIIALLKKLKETVPGTVVITDGPNGSYAFDGAQMWYQKAHPIPAIERTGAGDAYATGFTAAMHGGTSMAQAMLWGTLNGASVTQKIGPHAGLLTKEQMQQWAKQWQQEDAACAAVRLS